MLLPKRYSLVLYYIHSPDGNSFTCVPITRPNRGSSRAHALPKLKVKVLPRDFTTRPLVPPPGRNTATSNEQQQQQNRTTQYPRLSHQEKINHVRSNPPHHRPLPRAILPPDRPHPRQSTPDPWRASDNRCRWAGQCLLEPRKSDEPTVRKRMDS